jgi:hypothetical protein
MTTRRKFNFPLSTLTSAADSLSKALVDPAYQTSMTQRLGADFITVFPQKITRLAGGSAAQSSQTGELSNLTTQQQEAFIEMERLAAGARRSARLAFPGQDTVLSAEFQVGEAESKSISATIARAHLTHTATLKYASQLQAKGWLPDDTTALAAAIATLGNIAPQQDQAGDDRMGLTNDKIIIANDLYTDCLAIQNAARLQYPAKTDAAGNVQNVTPRARFLLDEFPPRDREKPDGGTQPPPVPSTP